MLQVFGNDTGRGLHQQQSHPPKQCRDVGLLHVQPMWTYKGLSALLCSLILSCNVCPVSPTYDISQEPHGTL